MLDVKWVQYSPWKLTARREQLNAWAEYSLMSTISNGWPGPSQRANPALPKKIGQELTTLSDYRLQYQSWTCQVHMSAQLKLDKVVD